MNEITAAFAKALRAGRASLRISQEQLADIAGVSVSTIGLYEREKAMPNLYTAIKLSRILGIDINRLYGLN